MAWFLREVINQTEASTQLLERGVRYRRVFKLWSDSGQTVGATDVLTWGGVPRVGDAYFDALANTTDISARCASVTVRPIGDDAATGTAWLIEAQFQNFSGRVVAAKRDEPIDALAVNPLLRPPSLEWGLVFRERDLRIARFLGSFALGSTTPIGGPQAMRPVTSSAGEPPPVLPTYEAGELCLRYRVNLSPAVWTPSAMRTWANALNSSTFLGDPAHTWRVSDIHAPRVWEATPGSVGQYYYDVQYTLEFKSSGWYRDIEDRGSYYLAAPGNQRYNFQTADGEPTIGLLDGLGAALNPQTQTNARTMRYVPLDWPDRDFATIPGGPINP